LPILDVHSLVSEVAPGDDRMAQVALAANGREPAVRPGALLNGRTNDEAFWEALIAVLLVS